MVLLMLTTTTEKKITICERLPTSMVEQVTEDTLKGKGKHTLQEHKEVDSDL